MLTNTDHNLLIVAAGPTFSWPTPSSRPTSDIRAGLFAWLKDACGNVCAFCGEEGVTQACHIVSAGGDGRRGYVPGNIAMGCDDCNETDRAAGPIVEYATILRPDLIPTEWPVNSELRKLGIDIKVENAKRREEKKRKRGM